jgi:transaldolase
VKVPYTATGLLGARLLKNSGIKINFTLEFSARQNIVVTRIARPDYVNVFLGRIGAYMINNKLGDGSGAGEMAVLSSQKWVSKFSGLNPWPTKLIAASLRNYEQLELLAGTNVYTMPPKVAAAGHANLNGKFSSQLNENYKVSIFDDAIEARTEKFWEVDERVLTLAERLSLKIPDTGDELITRAHEAGCEDMFPNLARDEEKNIASDGKIPVYARWEKKINDCKIAPDTLLTLAGLASFTSDQNKLDKRIKDIIG